MDATVETKYIYDKYIYLDWNVFKYMKEPRKDKSDLDKELYQTVCKLKKKYRFPTSLAHIKDRLRNYSEKYRKDIEEDFSFVHKISDGKFVTYIEEEKVLGLVSADICGVIDDYINNCSCVSEANIDSNIGQEPVSIDINKLNIDHPMYEYLKNHNFEYNATNMTEFLEDLYMNIFNDNSKYSNFRDWIRKFDINTSTFHIKNFSEMHMLDKLMYKMAPFLLSYSCTELDKLSQIWERIAKRFFGEGIKEPSMEELLMQGYTLLDMHPLMKKEKLKKKKNTLDNIVRDGNHCYYASRGKYFVTEDEGTRFKSQFLYKAYGIDTKVYSVAEFVSNVNAF